MPYDMMTKDFIKALLVKDKQLLTEVLDWLWWLHVSFEGIADAGLKAEALCGLTLVDDWAASPD